MKKTRSKWFYTFLILFSAIFIAAVLVGFAGCSGCGGDKAEVESVSLSSTSLTIEEGKTSTITASVKMSDDSAYEGSYSWTTSDSSVATVFGSGASATVTGVKEGSATITVTVDSGDKATCSVTVTEATTEPEPEPEPEPDATVTGVEISPSTLSLDTVSAKTGSLTASVTMSDESSYSGSYTWASTDETVATVAASRTSASTATVTAVGAGTTSVTVTVGSGENTEIATCEVTVTDSVAGLSLASKLDLGLNEGSKTDTLTATVNLGSGSAKENAEVVWSVADVEKESESGEDPTNEPSPESVSQDSTSAVVTIAAKDDDPNTITVTALSVGEATITATYTEGSTNYSATCAVTVYEDLFVYEAEDAMLFNSPDSSMGSTEILDVEESSSFTGVTQVKNFNVKGDKIVFEVIASAAITAVTIDAIVSPTTDDFDASEHNGFITVNGVDAGATGTVAKSAYGAVTAETFLTAGVNYIEIVLDVSGSSFLGMNLGYMNVDKIEIEWNDATDQGATTPTISKVDNVAGDVVEVEAGQINTLAAADAYLMNKNETTTDSSLMSVTDDTISNITAGDEVVYQLNSAAAVSAVLAVTLGTGESANNLTVKVNGTAVFANSDGSYTMSLSKGVNYVELIAGSSLSDSLSVSAVTLTTVADGVESSRVGAIDDADDRLSLGNGVALEATDVTVVYDPDTRTYTISGTTATLTEEQAAALQMADHAGNEYITFQITANAGETITITTYHDSSEESSWTLYGDDASNQSTTDGAFVLDFLATKDWNTWSMVLEVTDSNGATVTYTVVVEDLVRGSELSRVGAIDGEDKRLVVDSDNNLAFVASDITVVYDPETKTYTISGTSSVMGDALAKAMFNETDAECEYITFEIAVNAGETIKITTYNGETQENTWTLYGSSVTGESTTDGTFVLDLTDHTEGDWKMVVDVTYADGSTESYTVVIGTIASAHQTAESSRVAAATAGDDRLVLDSASDLAFDASEITVTYDSDTRTYTISGTGTEMGEDLAKAMYDESHSSCKYITFVVNANAGETIKITTYNGSTVEKVWAMYGSGVSTTLTDDDNNKELDVADGAFVVDLTDHSSGAWSMVIEVTYANGDSLTYAVVLSEGMETSTSQTP